MIDGRADIMCSCKVMMNWSVLVVLCLVTLSNVEVGQSECDGKCIIIIILLLINILHV